MRAPAPTPRQRSVLPETRCGYCRQVFLLAAASSHWTGSRCNFRLVFQR